MKKSRKSGSGKNRGSLEVNSTTRVTDSLGLTAEGRITRARLVVYAVIGLDEFQVGVSRRRP